MQRHSPFRPLVLPVAIGFLLLLLGACSSPSEPPSPSVATSPPTPSPPTPTPAPPEASQNPLYERLPALTDRHVFLVVLENHGYGQIIGSPDTPYLNRLAKRGGLATNFTATRHPSLPNYIAMTAGSTMGITSNCTDCAVRGRNLADQLEDAGLTWRAYEESIPSPCFLGAYSGSYVKKHSPFLYYKSIINRPARCKEHVVGFDALERDIATERLPNFALIVPNEAHDMHTGTASEGDRFLKRLLPRIFATEAFTDDGIMFITWDEDEGTPANKIATIVVSPLTEPGTRSATPFDHYSLLRTMEEVFGLAYLRHAGDPGTQSMAPDFLE